MKRVLFILTILVGLCSCDINQFVPKGNIYYIGVALDYQNTNVNSLYGTINDGLEIEKAFKSNAIKCNRYFKSFPLYQQGFSHNSKTIKNQSYPSVEHIFNVINNIATISHNNDLTIFYFSGHGKKDDGSILCGTTNSETGKTLLEIDQINEDYLISPSKLKNQLSKIEGKKLIIIDACYSGFFRDSLNNTIDITQKQASFTDCYKKLFANNDKEDNNIYLLCATEQNNFSHEPSSMIHSHPHGYFSKALLEGLGWCYGEKGIITHEVVPPLMDKDNVQGILAKGLPPASRNSKELSVDDLYYYVKTHQEIPLKKVGNNRSFQHPCVTGNRNDLILFNY